LATLISPIFNGLRLEHSDVTDVSFLWQAPHCDRRGSF
jgi:hypothetical protein